MAIAGFGPWRWRRSLLAFATWAGFASPGQAFEASVLQPAFTVVVPALPSIPMAAPARPSGASASTRLVGGDGRLDLTISTDDAHRPITPRECAGSFLRMLVARPGMPPRDSVYRAPLNEALFLVIYILDGEPKPKPERTLHAHLLSTAASTHCVEAHFARAMQPGEEEDAWRRSFTGASIVEGGR